MIQFYSPNGPALFLAAQALQASWGMPSNSGLKTQILYIYMQ